jgi:hypothetical protein
VAFAGTQATTGNTTLTANLTVGGNADVAGTLELGSSNITTSTSAGLLRHEAGGLEFDASAITTGGMIKGDSSGVMEILAKGAGNTILTMNAGATDFAWVASAGGATLVGKTSAETVNNSSTMQDDDTLKFTGAADTNYTITGSILYQSNATADFKWQLEVPGSSTADFGAPMLTVGGVSSWAGREQGVAVETLGAGVTFPYVGSIFMGTVRMDGSGGEVVIQWAQNTANASNTQVLPGAWITYEEIS